MKGKKCVWASLRWDGGHRKMMGATLEGIGIEACDPFRRFIIYVSLASVPGFRHILPQLTAIFSLLDSGVAVTLFRTENLNLKGSLLAEKRCARA